MHSVLEDSRKTNSTMPVDNDVAPNTDVGIAIKTVRRFILSQCQIADTEGEPRNDLSVNGKARHSTPRRVLAGKRLNFCCASHILIHF